MKEIFAFELISMFLPHNMATLKISLLSFGFGDTLLTEAFAFALPILIYDSRMYLLIMRKIRVHFVLYCICIYVKFLGVSSPVSSVINCSAVITKQYLYELSPSKKKIKLIFQ